MNTLETIANREDLVIGNRNAVYLLLDRNYRIIDRLSGSEYDYPDFAAGKYVGDLISSSNHLIKAAFDLAFNGKPSQAAFGLTRDGEKLHCEIHCFPPVNIDGDFIGCFLTDRTVEENYSIRLQRKIYELDIISQAVRAFAETRNLSDILRIILLGVTAGPGLGFNRGFILLSNEAVTSLKGCLATGPSTPEEAGIIWHDLTQRSLTFEEVLRLYKLSSNAMADIHVNRLIASLNISLLDNSNFIVRAVKDRKSLIADAEILNEESNFELKNIFGAECIAVVPLIYHENLQGVLLADNLITRKPIMESDLKILEIFARYASDAIENSRLYGKLEQQILRLKEANEKIIRSRENLIKAEKLSSIAKMALDVAHEIRNPLTVIGGFANSHLRKNHIDEGSKRILEIISKQASRIEGALDRFSSVVQLSEKKEGLFNLVTLIKEIIVMFSTEGSQELPTLLVDSNAENIEIYVDQGLFYQAAMVILKNASLVAGGMQRVQIRITRGGTSTMIFISRTDNCMKYAEDFYKVLRMGKGEYKYQEMAVALEILQHYGGGIGIQTFDGGGPQLYVEMPLPKGN